MISAERTVVIDARLLVGLRGPDLTASTARLALVEKMGFGDRLAGLKRWDFFQFELEAALPPQAIVEGLKKVLARQSTLVLAVEDLHWSDPSTLDWISSAAARIDPAKLLFIATMRPISGDEADGPLALLRESVRARRLALEIVRTLEPGQQRKR